MFQIPAAPRGIPMAWQGHFYARRGESLVALDMSKYEEIRRQTVNEDWTAEVVPDATIDDLDTKALAKALKDHKVLSRKQINELLWNKLPMDFTEEQKMSKIKNLLYKMHKNDEIWLDEDRMWHRKEF